MSAKKRPLNGKNGSLPTAPLPATNRIQRPSKELVALLGKVFDTLQSGKDRRTHKRAQWAFTFHMTDWLNDLDRLTALFGSPETADREQAARDVAGFLYHVVPHLMAAARNLLDFRAEDIFVELDKEPSDRAARD